jgi:hypothetical protein
VVFWMLIWETVIWDMLTLKAFTPTSRRTAAMVTVAQASGGRTCRSRPADSR